MGSLHLVLTTHTTRHLRRSLLGVTCQRRVPETILISSDSDDPAITELVRAYSGEFGSRVVFVARKHHGECRLSQVRNNAVRELLKRGLAPSDRVVFMDGDCCPDAGALARHEELGARGELVIGFRVDLSEEQTEGFDEAAVRAGGPPANISEEQRRLLAERHDRYTRQLWLKRFWLTKAHKPKILGANFSVNAGKLLDVNGFDEEFIGWGQEDDDFSRRVYKSGGRAVIGIREAVVYHQWHPTRAPGSWDESAGVARFKMKLPSRCARGIQGPVEQHAVTAVSFDSGREVYRRAH